MDFNIFGQGDPAQESSDWAAAFGDPRVQSALLSTGLALMQPQALGQTGLGHMAQALGAGGAAVAAADQRAQQEEKDATRLDMEQEKLDIAQKRLKDTQRRTDIAQQRANTHAANGGRARGGMTASQLFNAQARIAAAEDKAITDEARGIVQQLSKDINVVLGQPPANAALAPYAGKTIGQIKDMLRSDPAVQQRLKKSAVSKVKPPAAAAEDDDEDEEETPVTEISSANRNPGANMNSSQYYEGQTATNPQTGQRAVYQNGRWVYQ